MCEYQIIYLNGPSSSGKTTLAKALQEKLSYPFLLIGIDKVIGMMPAKLNNWEGGEAPDGFSWGASYDEEGQLINKIQMGPFARKMSDTLKEIVLTMAKLDHYIIIDDVAFGKRDVDRWRDILKEFKVLWIGIQSPLSILEERERKRGDRIMGSARAQYYETHQNVIYDLTFDTSKESLDNIVHAISRSIK